MCPVLKEESVLTINSGKEIMQIWSKNQNASKQINPLVTT